MFLVYMYCKAYHSLAIEPEPDLPAGYVVAWDHGADLNDVDYDALNRCNESLWIVPGTMED